MPLDTLCLLDYESYYWPIARGRILEQVLKRSNVVLREEGCTLSSRKGECQSSLTRANYFCRFREFKISGNYDIFFSDVMGSVKMFLPSILGVSLSQSRSCIRVQISWELGHPYNYVLGLIFSYICLIALYAKDERIFVCY